MIVQVVPGSEVADATAAGITIQAQAFAGAIRGDALEFPGEEASTRAVTIGRAVQEAARTVPSVAVA